MSGGDKVLAGVRNRSVGLPWREFIWMYFSDKYDFGNKTGPGTFTANRRTVVTDRARMPVGGGGSATKGRCVCILSVRIVMARF